jgi:hypothetical protein
MAERRKQKCLLFVVKAAGNWPKEKGVSFQYNGEVEGGCLASRLSSF